MKKKTENEHLDKISQTAGKLNDEEQEKLYYLVQGMAIASEQKDKTA